jgi:hypothetical protein
MDGTRFDAVARGMARAASRRAVVVGVIGAMAATSASSTLAVKPRKRKGKHQGEGESIAEDDILAEGALTGGVWEATMEICHFNAESGGVDRILVSAPELPTYLNAGDTLYIDCCVDADCQWQPCATPTGCIEGACMYEITAGAPCALSDGLTGVCGKEGTCQSTAPPVEPVAVPYNGDAATPTA